MSYQQTVEAHHRTTFSDNFMMVAQQRANVLRSAVTMLPAKGEAQSIADLVGTVDATEAEDYGRRNPDNPPARSRRWLVRPNGIETGQYITKEEIFDQAMDPRSMLVQTHVSGLERKVFDKLLGVRKKANGAFEIAGGGILGSVATGKTPSTATSSLPTGNYIAVDKGSTGTPKGLNTDKLRAATEAMELADFGLETDDEIYGLITPKQKTDLINLALAAGTSLNVFQQEQIRDGKPTQLLGVTWLFTNRLPVDASGYRLVPLWSKKNIVAGVWQDIVADMWNDTNAKKLPYIFADAYIEAGRVEDGGVRVIRCLES